MIKRNLQLFGDVGPQVIGATQNYNVASPLNTTKQNTTTGDMSPTMKTFYDTSLLENARENMVFTQLGEKQAMKGNTVEWRKFNTFAPALDNLVEGVIPTGQTFGMTAITAQTTQHGDYVAVTDRLEMESYDDVIYGATEEMGAAEGETFDILTRNILVAGQSRVFAPKISATGEETVVDDRANLDATAILTPKLVAQVATWLKKNKAPKINGYYVMVIHPSQAFDLRQSEEWKEFHKYADVAPIYNGEIGTLHGIRFIESNNVKVYKEEGGIATYAAIALGAKAFGVLDPAGEGMEMIIKDKSQVGGPLNQFSTIGYKFCHGAKILYQERLLRVETGSSYSAVDVAN